MRRVFVLSLLGILLAAAPLCAEVRKPGARDRCPVCGMFVAPYPEWTATLLFKDGSQVFFDGAKDLFRYYFSLPSPEDGRRPEAVEGIYLTDYYTTRLMPIEELVLVVGSDVYGPMGHELVAVAGEEAAKTFARDHKGQQLIRFGQLTEALLPAD